MLLLLLLPTGPLQATATAVFAGRGVLTAAGSKAGIAVTHLTGRGTLAAPGHKVGLTATRFSGHGAADVVPGAKRAATSVAWLGQGVGASASAKHTTAAAVLGGHSGSVLSVQSARRATVVFHGYGVGTVITLGSAHVVFDVYPSTAVALTMSARTVVALTVSARTAVALVISDTA